MRFLVPQFIEVEDKIIGPLTLKQGVYLIGGLGLAIILVVKFGFLLGGFLGIPILILAFALAFVNVQGRPFIHLLSSAFFFLTKNKLYLWKKTPTKKILTTKKSEDEAKETTPASVEMNQSKLKKLAWSLDTNNIFDTPKKKK